MEIKLKKLHIENFMIYEDAEFDFSEKTRILGKNGKGKSSIVNAYMWLFFNCDYGLKNNPPIRRMVNGKTVDDMDVAVTAVLDIDGVEITVKKVQKRTYGEDNTYKDNNKYFINEVPKTLNAYNKYFGCDMEVLKMCSNINSFLNKETTEMREVLFGAVNSVSDKEIAEKNADLELLLPLFKKYSVEEIAEKNKSIKRIIDKELPLIDGQIKEKERDIAIKQDIDLAELELLKNDLKKQLQENLEQQNCTEKAVEKYQNLSDKIISLKNRIADLQNKANEALKKQGADINVQIQMNYELLEKIMLEEKTAEQKIKQCKSAIEYATEEKNRLADDWRKVNNEIFNENSVFCPTCGQELPKEKIEGLKTSFNQSKTDRLAKIEKNGMEQKQYIEEVKATLDKLAKENQANLLKKAEIDKLVEELKFKWSELPQSVDISGTPEYKTATTELIATQKELEQFSDNGERHNNLKSVERELQQKLSECENKIAMADTSADEERLEELKSQRLEFEQSKANAEKILFLLDELDKAKNEALTDNINSKFKLVQWQLFELAKNGNYKNCCIPTVNGKSILNALSNKGNRILGKVDICNSIQKMHNISCPIWLDDCENLDNENQSKVASIAENQLIMLAVTDDDKVEVIGY